MARGRPHSLADAGGCEREAEAQVFIWKVWVAAGFLQAASNLSPLHYLSGQGEAAPPAMRGRGSFGGVSPNVAEIAELTDATFGDQVFKGKAPTLVEFWAPWCKPCLFLNPVLEEAARDLAGLVQVVKLNVDENPVAATVYSVRSIPTMILYRGGDELEKFVGYLGKDELVGRVRAVLGEGEEG
jgi:thioredoxin 1